MKKKPMLSAKNCLRIASPTGPLLNNQHRHQSMIEPSAVLLHEILADQVEVVLQDIKLKTIKSSRTTTFPPLTALCLIAPVLVNQFVCTVLRGNLQIFSTRLEKTENTERHKSESRAYQTLTDPRPSLAQLQTESFLEAMTLPLTSVPSPLGLPCTFSHAVTSSSSSLISCDASAITACQP